MIHVHHTRLIMEHNARKGKSVNQCVPGPAPCLTPRLPAHPFHLHFCGPWANLCELGYCSSNERFRKVSVFMMAVASVAVAEVVA
jgi:hypothetical protein